VNHLFVHPVLQVFHLQVGQLRKLAESLDEDSLWWTPPEWNNSVGALARHVTGNISHYVGRGMLGTDYMREREREFSDPPGDRGDLLAGLDAAMGLLEQADSTLSEEAWTAPWTSPDSRSFPSLGQFLSSMSCHAAYHNGQASVVARLVRPLEIP
jgi:uncharacterized damage-inducible protein DinB